MAALLVAASTLAGCAVLGGGAKPLDTYELTAPVPSTKGRRLRHRQIIVAEPSALKALDGENIVIRASNTSLQYLDGAQWADRLPKIVQARLVEAFQRSGRLGGTGKPGEGLAVDYQVIANISAFEIRVDNGEHAYVAITARLLDDRNGVVRSTREFEAGSPVGSGGNDAYVAALDQAFGQVAGDLVNWALSRM
ncbi:MAG: ABC-type transport auxiliary lipoprotein family protein [Rhizobiaceae bacterium]